MAGHSHWAGIKHKKGRADEVRSKTFSKLSREITVAAKLGDRNPEMNPRLRSAIQAAKQANMPKDNILRAINKSELSGEKNYENLRYEAFGPFNSVFIIETLTENKNRSAANIRTVLQKNGGRLGEEGSTAHLFNNCGILKVNKKKISEEEMLEITSESGAKDYSLQGDIYEIICNKDDFYKVKSAMEKKIENFEYTGIEWRPNSHLILNNQESNEIFNILSSLEDLEDVQNVFTNVNLKKLYENNRN